MKKNYYIKKKDRVTIPCIHCGKQVTGFKRKMFCSPVCNLLSKNKIYLPNTQLETEQSDNAQMVTNRVKRDMIVNLYIPYEDIED